MEDIFNSFIINADNNDFIMNIPNLSFSERISKNGLYK